MLQKKRLTKEQALPQIKQYCAYQERSHKEAREKLYSFGLYKADVEQLITQLIEEDYLNEERFAKQFSGGKFRMKNWGRIKITYELRQKMVSSYSIKIALKEIEESAYMLTLKKLAAAKWKSLKMEPALSKKSKTYTFLLGKGYEAPLVQKVLAELDEADEK
jgi:regulatory protein